jgi:hypothetical protein
MIAANGVTRLNLLIYVFPTMPCGIRSDYSGHTEECAAARQLATSGQMRVEITVASASVAAAVAFASPWHYDYEADVADGQPRANRRSWLTCGTTPAASRS